MSGNVMFQSISKHFKYTALTSAAILFGLSPSLHLLSCVIGLPEEELAQTQAAIRVV